MSPSIPNENFQTISNNTSNQHSPCESTEIFESKKPCNECDASRNRENLLTQELSLAQAEVERLKQFVQKFVGSILSGGQNVADLANVLTPEKPWMLSAK